MCLGTLANAAFFMINLTNFIVDAARRDQAPANDRGVRSIALLSLAQPFYHRRPWKPVGGVDVRGASCDQWERGSVYLLPTPANRTRYGRDKGSLGAPDFGLPSQTANYVTFI